MKISNVITYRNNQWPHCIVRYLMASLHVVTQQKRPLYVHLAELKEGGKERNFWGPEGAEVQPVQWCKTRKCTHSTQVALMPNWVPRGKHGSLGGLSSLKSVVSGFPKGTQIQLKQQYRPVGSIIHQAASPPCLSLPPLAMVENGSGREGLPTAAFLQELPEHQGAALGCRAGAEADPGP